MKWPRLAALLALTLAFSLQPSALVWAASLATAFTYQGQLRDRGQPADGIYDLRYAIYDAATSGVQVGPTLTNTATPVANGLFTVTLDFGPGVFTGEARWLEIGVRTNGSAAEFPTLSPRQPLTPAPYALFAPSAGAAGQLTGTLTPGNIASGTITSAMIAPGAVTGAQLASNLTVTGTITASRFQGHGALPWESVAGATYQAAPNTGYLLTDTNPTVITLPGTAKVGDVVRVSGTGAGGWFLATAEGQSVVGRAADASWTPHESIRNWQSVASSADGMRLVAVAAVDRIYTSPDAGATWTPRETNRSWRAVASSADGNSLVAVVSGGQIYTSTDAGLAWTARETNRPWRSVASSADGRKLVAAVFDGPLYTSTDAGETWTARETSRWWSAVASSANGSNLLAAVQPGRLYTSTNAGVTWTPRESSRSWRVVASSATGSNLLAAVQLDAIYISTNAGATWTATDATSTYWGAVASSADGTKLLAGEGGGLLYKSADGGVTWTPHESVRTWMAVASSADGNSLVALDASPGRIYGSSGKCVPKS